MSSENGPHGLVKCEESRVPCSEETPEDRTLGQTENHVDEGNRINECEDHSDSETYNIERTSSLSSHTSHVTEPSEGSDAGSKDTDIPEASNTTEPPDTPLLMDSKERGHPKDSSLQGGALTKYRQQTDGESEDGGADSCKEEEEDGEKEKQDEEEDEKNEKNWISQRAAGRNEVESSRHYSSSAPGPSTSSSSSPPPLLPSDDVPCPPHVMAQVWVRNVRGMQDSKSLDEISQACGGGSGARGGGRGGQSEGRRATISSALELEGTVSHEGDLTNFITKNLEQKIKMSSKPSLDCSDSDCSGPIYRSRGLTRRPADIPPIDPAVLLDLQRHAQEVAQSVEMMMRSLNGTIQNMTALSVGYIQTYRDSVDSLGESVDMSIKGMYTLMARCEELDRSMQPIHTLAAQIRDIKRTLDALEAICK